MAKCPYCKQPVTLETGEEETGIPGDEVRKQEESLITKEVTYSCPHCEAILGFGFFIGGVLTGRS